MLFLGFVFYIRILAWLSEDSEHYRCLCLFVDDHAVYIRTISAEHKYNV